MSVKIEVFSKGEGTCALTNREGAGVWAKINGGSKKFLGFSSFKMLMLMELGDQKEEKEPKETPLEQFARANGEPL